MDTAVGVTEKTLKYDHFLDQQMFYLKILYRFSELFQAFAAK